MNIKKFNNTLHIEKYNKIDKKNIQFFSIIKFNDLNNHIFQ